MDVVKPRLMSLLPHIAIVVANAIGLLQQKQKRARARTKDYNSKVDGIQTQLIPVAFELKGQMNQRPCSTRR